MRSKSERQEVEAWEIVDTLYPRSSVTGFSRGNFSAVKKFIDRLGLFQVKDAADIALRKKPWGGAGLFRYFCGVCWRMIRDRDDASS